MNAIESVLLRLITFLVRRLDSNPSNDPTTKELLSVAHDLIAAIAAQQPPAS